MQNKTSYSTESLNLTNFIFKNVLFFFFVCFVLLRNKQSLNYIMINWHCDPSSYCHNHHSPPPLSKEELFSIIQKKTIIGHHIYSLHLLFSTKNIIITLKLNAYPGAQILSWKVALGPHGTWSMFELKKIKLHYAPIPNGL